MRSRTRVIAAVAAASAFGLAAVSAVNADAPANPAAATASVPVDAVGLGADGLTVSVFSLTNPRQNDIIGQVTGLAGDTKLVGIDMRIANKKFYGVGDQGGIYTLNRNDASLTKVGQLTAALSGTAFGVDFNPAADRLRIISNTGQSLRHDVNPGGATIVDGTLAYTPGTAATGVFAAAYTNNDNTTVSGTTLFDIDATLNQVVQQIPANDGTLALSGPLGVDVTEVGGFDIWTGRRAGVASSNVGFAILRTSTSAAVLWNIDLLSGKAYRVGNFAAGNMADLAVIQP